MFHVKHEVRRLLDAVADRLGVPIAGAQSDACAELADWLAPSAARLGLTRFGTPVAFAENLMVPALHLLPHLHPSAQALAEVGPGNGGLGLTLAVLRSDCPICLLDRRRRVCDFLSLAAARFGLSNCQARCVDLRSREAASEKYDLVTARAVTAPAVLLGHLPHLLAPSGRIALFRSDAEIEVPAGLRSVSHDPTVVPGLWLDIYSMEGCAGPAGDRTAN